MGKRKDVVTYHSGSLQGMFYDYYVYTVPLLESGHHGAIEFIII